MSTKNQASATQEVANRFNQFAKEGKWLEAQKELFADNVVSIEAASYPGPQTVSGKNAVIKKGEEFAKMVETTHGGYCTEPLVAGNHFTVAMGHDVTMKGKGRSKSDEIAVYEVKDSKIVKEQFFY